MWTKCGGNEEISGESGCRWFSSRFLWYLGGMKIRIQHKMFLAMLVAAAAVVLCMFLVMRWSFDRGFLRYVHALDIERLEAAAGKLEEAYAEKGSWQFLRDDPRQLRRLMRGSPADRPRGGPDAGTRAEDDPAEAAPHRRGRPGMGPMRQGPPRFPPDPAGGFFQRVVLLDEGKKPVLGPAMPPGNLTMKPLSHGGATVGYLGVLPPRIVSDARQERFVREQRHAFALIALAVVFVAALLSIPLARQMVRRIRDLASATHRLASGRFDTRVSGESSDELGQLSRDFNTLALTLEKNEEARRQWVADISHELRTPLSVLRGEIEALQDGVREATPQNVAALHAEVMKLGRLIDDLYELSLSDLGALTYRRTETDLGPLLAQALDPYRNEFAGRGIALETDVPAGRPLTLFADPDRLHQLFSNLLENSLKYVEGGGRLSVRVERRERTAEVHFEDSGPGVPASELGKLFDRLYRVEGSRSRATGGAGLGLAICRNIAEAHNGTIAAFPSSMGGLWVKLELPLSG
ncbi:MAG: sensor histidine kinase [Deltaproteobacteria bacterium]|nr:sensor histidine kinase [Deltaproteobacteria bacterium]